MSKRGRKHRRRRIAKAVSNVLDHQPSDAFKAAQELVQSSGRIVRSAKELQAMYPMTISTAFTPENDLETDIPKVVRKHTKNGSKSVSKNRCTK